MRLKVQKIVVWVLGVILMAGLVCATADLLGQTNKQSADAGTAVTDMEMATLDSIKKPANSSNINWAEVVPVEKKLKEIDAMYKVAVDKAGQEKMYGTVSEATRSEGMALAQQYSESAEQLATVYEKNNMITRAKTVRQLAKTRLANAQMSFNEMSSERVALYQEEQKKLGKARSEYFAENDLSAADRAELKQSILPRVENNSKKFDAIVEILGNIIAELSSQALSGGGMSVASVSGCAASAVTSAAVSGDPSQLLSSARALLDLVELMSSDTDSFVSDLSAL